MSDKKDSGSPFQHSKESRITVLSTKKLSVNQRELLLNQGIGLVERNFISIVPLSFDIPTIPPNIIFTSKNAVKAILDHPLKKQLQQKKIFCVGEKTAEFLKKHGFSISRSANCGSELASEIIKDFKAEEFLFFCGKRRHDELPKRLKGAEVKLTEIEVYDTQPVSNKIDRNFDGVLFFSPSAVRSYCDQNDLFNSVAFCIGTTTSEEAKKHTKNIVLASKPSIENVVVQAVKYFKL